MGAGAVIIALHHEQNIFKMGGLKKDLKLVYITMFIATLAISGIPPFAGFFSKDAILVTAFASEHYILWGMGSLTAMLTAFYMFRLLFTVFHSQPTETKKVHAVPAAMSAPLVILALGSATVGFLGANEAYGGSAWINTFLALPDAVLSISHTKEYMLGGMNVLFALLGMGLAYKLFAKEAQDVKVDTLFKKVVINKFYIDEIYDFFVLKPLLILSHFIAEVMDPKIFDGFINFNVWGYRKSALYFSKLQNGKVRYYALYILIGVSGMSCYLLLKLGAL
jgi:NADH-quinone oxidoreductase subunit L